MASRPVLARVLGCVLGCALGVTSLLLPSQACAQPCRATQSDEARNLFLAGSSAVQDNRWAEAIGLFERSYALSCRAAALYNLALALRGLGRHRAARDAFDRLMRNHPDLSGTLAETTRQYRAEEAARVAVLELAGIGPDVRADIHLDGHAYPDEGERPVRLETDGGPHSLIATIPDHQPFLWDGSLTAGETQRIQVTFDPVPTAGGEGGIDPLAIILPILIAALIGTGVGIAIWQQDERLLQPHSDRVVTVERSM